MFLFTINLARFNADADCFKNARANVATGWKHVIHSTQQSIHFSKVIWFEYLLNRDLVTFISAIVLF